MILVPSQARRIGTDHSHMLTEGEPRYRPGEEVRPALAAIEQCHPDLRPIDRNDKSRHAAATADVDQIIHPLGYRPREPLSSLDCGPQRASAQKAETLGLAQRLQQTIVDGNSVSHCSPEG